MVLPNHGQALRGFYSNCFSNLTKPKIWRKATVIAIPKFNTPTDDPKNYRLISLLCVPFKLLARLLLARLEPIIDPHSPDEQADFRRGRNTVHQIVNLTDDIEETFESGHKAGVILVDLTAEYDTVWHQGLTLKLFLTITLCGSSLLSSPTAALHSRQATDRSADCVDSKHGVPRAQSWLRYYLTFTSAISLLPRHPITHMQTTLHSCTSIEIGRQSSWMAQHSTPISLRVKLDRQLASNSILRHYVAKWRQGITFYVVLLVHSGELTHVLRLRTGALALVYSAAEYAAPAWCSSTHVNKMDVTLNDTMRIVNACYLLPTPVKYLPVLSGIAPPALPREHHTSMLIKKALLSTSHLYMPALQQPKTSAANAYTLSSTLQPPSSIPSKLQLQPNGAMET